VDYPYITCDRNCCGFDQNHSGTKNIYSQLSYEGKVVKYSMKLLGGRLVAKEA
jgi:hypothetical protein